MPVEPAPTEAPRGDAYVTLRGATWADYQRMLGLRGEKAVPRVTFLEGELELMTPSRTHEILKSMIGRLVEAWCMAKGVDITPYGSWTLENKDADRGAEPDECYVLGDDDDPDRPDLAIEVIWTSGGLNKLEVYRMLGVREVWVWKKGAISVHVLDGHEYREVNQSVALPELDREQLLRFVDIRPMTKAVRQYRALLDGK